MDKQQPVEPQKIEKLHHFNIEIPLPEGSTIAPYKSYHSSTSKKSKKSKRKFEEFTYYRFIEDKQKIMKVLYKDDDNYIINAYSPFTNPISEMETTTDLHAKKVLKVIKTEAAYIGHFEDKIVVKKLSEVKIGQDGNQIDTIGDNFEVLKIENKTRFDQFMKILGNHPRALQISIRVIIDESVINQPKIIDYELFKRQKQLKDTNLVFKQGNKKQESNK